MFEETLRAHLKLCSVEGGWGEVNISKHVVQRKSEWNGNSYCTVFERGMVNITPYNLF